MEDLIRTIFLGIYLTHYFVSSNNPNNHVVISLPREKTVTVTYMDKHLSVSMLLNDDRMTYTPFRIIHPAGMHGVPGGFYKLQHSYVTQAFYTNNMKLVVYVEHDVKTGRKEFLGANIPPGIPAEQSAIEAKGFPHRLDPDASTWFMNYNGPTYIVKQNPKTKKVLDVVIYPNERPIENYMKNNVVSTTHVHFADVYFKVYKDVFKGEIVGADVDHERQERAHGASSSGS